MLEKLFFVMRSAERKLRTDVAEYKLSPLFFRTVMMIFKSPEVTADSLSKLMVADKALMTRTLTELKERGLIERTRNPNDKRSFLLAPTDKLMEIKDDLFKIEADTEQYALELLKREGVRL